MIKYEYQHQGKKNLTNEVMTQKCLFVNQEWFYHSCDNRRIQHQQNIHCERENLSVKSDHVMKSVKIWFCELCGMIQVPSSGAEDIKKVLPTPVNKIPIKLNLLSLLLLVCFGDFKFHILLYVTFFSIFFYYRKLSGKRAEGVISLFLIHKSNRPSLGTYKSLIWSQDCSPRLVSVQPHDLGLAPCLPGPHVPHLWERDDPHGLTRASMPWPENQASRAPIPTALPSELHGEGSDDFLEGATGHHFLTWGLNSWPRWWDHSFLFCPCQLFSSVSLPFNTPNDSSWPCSALGATGD